MRWPNPIQTLLLQTALLPPSQARISWDKWSQRVDLLQLDDHSNSFMALLGANLRRAGVTSEWTELLKGNYRHGWTRNQLAWRETADRANRLKEAGIGFILLGPEATLAAYYRDLPVRPLGMPRFLIAPPDADRVSPILDNQASWIGVLYPEFYAEHDTAVWASAVPTEFSGFTGRCLSPEEQFLWTCVAGFRHRQGNPLWWLADAATIILSTPAFDWDGLFRTAAWRQFLLPVRRTLDFLHHRLALDLPAAAFRCPRVGSYEYLEQSLQHRWIWKHLQPDLYFARLGGTVTFAENSGMRRSLFYAANRGWKHIRRRVPGWVRQWVKKITAQTGFQSPWYNPAKK